MKYFIYAFLILNIFTAFTSSAGVGNPGKANRFSGLWRGVDNFDGSISYFSISDSNNDGIMTVLLNDTFISRCKDEGYSTFPGLIEGTGTAKKNTLTVTYTFKCYDPKTNKLVEIRNGTTKVEYNTKGNFIVDEEGEIFNKISSHHL